MTSTVDLVWNLFEKTGEVRYYMLYKGLCNCYQKELNEGISL